LVAHDELDVVPGQAKLKFGGSHAGHNGLRDIHAQLGTGDYWRLRLGIGHPGVKAEVVNWVLKKPMAEQRDLIQESIARSVKAANMLIQGEMEKATVQIHTSKPPRPKPPRPEGV
jgi:PTH1 family peptidyl-tRNA hydrolase